MNTRLLRPLMGFTLLLCLGLPSGAAAQIVLQNTATGEAAGAPLLDAGATVHLTRAGSAVTDAVAEITPNLVPLGTAGVLFTYDILPTIGPLDQGITRIRIVVPPNCSGPAVQSVTVGGTALLRNDPVPGPGEFAATATGALLTLDLGSAVTTTLTPIRVAFTADADGPAGLATFQAVFPGAADTDTARTGDADGDPSDANSQAVLVRALADPLLTTVTALPAVVLADGVAASTVTVTVRDGTGTPLAGHLVRLGGDRGLLDLFTQPALVTDAQGVAVGAVRSMTPGLMTLTATDSTDAVASAQRPQVLFRQGEILDLRKDAVREEAMVGDVIPYRLTIRNPTASAVNAVLVDDTLPPNFKYVEGSARLAGAAIPDPSGNRTITFDVGTVPAFADQNGNGTPDPGEPGVLELSYDVVVGAGAEPGTFVNTAVARDVCPTCFLSNEAQATVEIVPDPVFELATIVGKVFLDRNADGDQDDGEPGVDGAMVALDDGTYALTDEHGRYHFPAVTPGQRLVKVNLLSLPGQARATSEAARVLWITPGLLARASFGVLYEEDVEEIGADAAPGLAVTGDVATLPLELRGDVEGMRLVVNDEELTLPGGNITLRGEDLGDVVELQDGKLSGPLVFRMSADRPKDAAGWTLRVWRDDAVPLHEAAGQGAPPASWKWDGRYGPQRTQVKGGVYEYQLEVTYTDGTSIRSARRLFGVNQRSFVSLNLRGSAFVTGSDRLSPDAETALSRAAEIMRQHPDEQVLVEGHTDDVGTAEQNLALSRARAEAAAGYLREREGIPAERLRATGYGETRPVAANDTPEGREQNRRVEIHGEVEALQRARLATPYLVPPEVRLNGRTVEVLPEGRFAARVEGDTLSTLQVELQDAQGRRVSTRVPVPTVQVLSPRGEIRVPVETPPSAEARGEVPAAPVPVDLVGRTEPGNTVLVDGEDVAVETDGVFRRRLGVLPGTHTYGILARNPEGVSRIANLTVRVAARDSLGQVVTVGDPVPELIVHLPPRGQTLAGPRFMVRGTTRPGNRITVNGAAAAVREDGAFRASVDLAPGPNTLVVEVTDPEGHRGTVRRDVEVAGDRIFFLALVDGVVGEMKASGNLENAGQDEETETFTEGRVAFYLKGRVAGKYLITSAFDTGRDEFKNLFKDLDDAEAGRLFRNLDPDRFYPIYGDESDVVYDAESQGKLYLAVDSEELGFLVGNYEVRLDGAELARFERAGYGARFVYRSGTEERPHTRVTGFGMDGGQIHVRSELAATGGSLFYLRHRDVVEGSESVSLVVRDKNTGLILSRTPQARNVDYRVKYPEGRITFYRPIPSVMAGGDLIDRELLSGHPVFVQVEYETREGAGDASAWGGRVEQDLGAPLRVGATYAKDERGSRETELAGVDAEVRLGEGSRVTAEYARSSGLDSLTFVSEDGGLTYGTALPGDRDEGDAWKVAAELDPGAWFGTPERVTLAGYMRRAEPGFSSSANLREQGSVETGGRLEVATGSFGRFAARHHREDLLQPGLPGSPDVTRLSSLSWNLRGERLGVSLEVQDRRTEDSGGNQVTEATVAAGEVRARLSDAIETRFEYQNALSGEENDQTTLGATATVNEHLTADVSGTLGDRGEAAQGTLRAAVGGAELYLSERLADESGAGTRATTVLGAEEALGATARVYTEYQWQTGDGEDRSVSLVGAEKTLHMGKGLRILLTGEHARTEGASGDTRRNALGGGIVYENPAGVALRSRAEVRTEDGARELTQVFTSHQLEVRLHPDLSLIGRYRFSRTEDDGTGAEEARFEEQSVGLAYRPVAHDRLNGLLRWTRLVDEEPVGLSRTPLTRTVSDVAMGEGALAVTPRVELVEKLAVKFQEDEAGTAASVRTRTLLNVNRLNLRLWKRLDLGTEYRILAQREAADQKNGWLNELTWGVNDVLRLGAGYNFTDFSDDEFSDNDYSVRGWFARIQGKY